MATQKVSQKEECRCYPHNYHYPTYCPVHDGDYSDWKWGRNMEDWDEYEY